MATPAAADHAVRIDPASYQLAAVAVGTDPSAVTGGGLVWVASRKDGTVTVVDPATNQVQETLPASGSGPVGRGGPGLAFSSGNLWVANTQQRRVDRAPLDTDATPIAVGASPVALAASPDAVWVAARTRGGGLLARIDAVTNQVVPTLRLPHASTGLAVTGDGADGLGRHRRRPGRPPRRRRARRVVERIALPKVPDQGAFGADAVWVTSGEGDAVMRVDVGGNAVQTIPVGNGPTGIAFGEDLLWVANGQDGMVSRINPRPTRSAPSIWGSGRPRWRSSRTRSGSRWPPDRSTAGVDAPRYRATTAVSGRAGTTRPATVMAMTAQGTMW